VDEWPTVNTGGGQYLGVSRSYRTLIIAITTTTTTTGSPPNVRVYSNVELSNVSRRVSLRTLSSILRMPAISLNLPLARWISIRAINFLPLYGQRAKD